MVEPAAPPWLQPVLVLPFAHVACPPRPGPDAADGTWVLHEDNLLRHLDPDPIPKNRKLVKGDVQRWAAALKTLQNRKPMSSDVAEKRSKNFKKSDATTVRKAMPE